MVGDEKKYSYGLEIKKQLSEDSWLRHLFNKINKPVTVVLEGGLRIQGLLKSLEYVRGVINLEIVTADKVYFINWRSVVALEAENKGIE